jgi:hypothetical protein
MERTLLGIPNHVSPLKYQCYLVAAEKEIRKTRKKGLKDGELLYK